MAENKSSDAGKVAIGAGLGAVAVLLATQRAKAQPGTDNEALLNLLAAIEQTNQDILQKNADILAAVLQGLENIGQLLGQLPGGGVGVQKKAEVILFSRTVPAATGVRIFERPQFSARVTEVVIHWPPGCNGLVDVAVNRGSERVLPRYNYISLNNVTLDYKFGEGQDIDNGIDLWVDIANADAVWPHTITVTATLEER
jgi:hypothetical protein